MSQYVVVLKHLATECKFNEAMRLERLRDRLVSGIRDKKMMSELLKLKLEELTFDIGAVKCIAIEQSYKEVEALVRVRPSFFCYPSQGQTRSLNLGRKLSLQRKSSHPIKSLLSKVATAVWAIMTVKVARTRGKNVTTVTRPVILKGPVKLRKGRRRIPDPQLIIWTVMMEIVMTT